MIIPDRVIEKIIEEMGQEFDSHDVILKLAQDNQRMYVEALAAINGDRLFQTLHSEVGRRIKEICDRQGYAGENSRSRDIFGQHSRCVLWSKR
jgi:hypothetical protein